MWKPGRPGNEAVGVINTAVRQAGAAAIQKSGEQLAEQLGAYIAGLVMSAAASLIVGGAVGAGMGKLIETLLQGVNTSEQLLLSITSNPYGTGKREVKHALTLPIRTQEELAFRNETLRADVQFLKSALTYAIDKTDEDQQLVILFFMALSEAYLPGGLESAAKRLDAMVLILNRQIEATKQKLSTLSARSPFMEGCDVRLMEQWERQNRKLEPYRTALRAAYEEKLRELKMLSDILGSTSNIIRNSAPQATV